MSITTTAYIDLNLHTVSDTLSTFNIHLHIKLTLTTKNKYNFNAVMRFYTINVITYLLARSTNDNDFFLNIS